MKERIFSLVILPLIFQGCVSIKSIDRPELKKISKLEHSRFDGIYNNLPVDSTEFTLWSNFSRKPKKIIDWKNHVVKIRFLKHRKAEVSLYHHDAVIAKSKIRGKIKDGYFYLRPKYILIPFFPILFFSSSEKCRIGIIGDSMVVDNASHVIAVMLIGGDSWHDSSKKYLKK